MLLFLTETHKFISKLLIINKILFGFYSPNILLKQKNEV